MGPVIQYPISNNRCCHGSKRYVDELRAAAMQWLNINDYYRHFMPNFDYQYQYLAVLARNLADDA